MVFVPGNCSFRDGSFFGQLKAKLLLLGQIRKRTDLVNLTKFTLFYI